MISTSIFILAIAALQAAAAPASATARIYVEDPLEADSLTNIFLDYGLQQGYQGELNILSVPAMDPAFTRKLAWPR